MTLWQKFTTILFIIITMLIIDLGQSSVNTAEARSRSGGRSFSRTRTYTPPTRQAPSTAYSSSRQSGMGSFGRGLAGGLMGGAIGSLLFGGMAHGGTGGGVGGSGIGIFQILLLAGLGFFIYKRFFSKPSSTANFHQHGSGFSSYGGSMEDMQHSTPPPPPPFNSNISPADGIGEIQQSDPQFDPEHFKEVAQDVFFQVQAGWMRRELSSYRHLLGSQLASEYEGHFAEMLEKGHINKLENIAVRNVEIVDAGLFGQFEAITILFTANLLDYTVDDKTGDLVDGSMTDPVKFAEKWTWARPVGEEIWLLEKIEVE